MTQFVTDWGDLFGNGIIWLCTALMLCQVGIWIIYVQHIFILHCLEIVLIWEFYSPYVNDHNLNPSVLSMFIFMSCNHSSMLFFLQWRALFCLKGCSIHLYIFWNRYNIIVIFRLCLTRWGTDSTWGFVCPVMSWSKVFFSWASDWFSLPDLAEVLANSGFPLVATFRM